jgi:hypothetical protein
VQFQPWCCSFPHARWAIWFDVLRQCGGWSEREQQTAAAAFLSIQMRDFHSGMLIKPFPECVDNQSLSLCLSSMVIGQLFAHEPGMANFANQLCTEAAERALTLIGAIPASGYSGEGSCYQCQTVANITVFMLKCLERADGVDWFDRELPPNGVSPRAILEVVMRSWMPGGLFLPWDDHGFDFWSTKAPMIYLAARTGDRALMARLIEQLNWSAHFLTAWGRDDTAWVLVHWPDWAIEENPSAPRGYDSWAHRDIGGALCNASESAFLFQMWDPASAIPLRSHVNPNALVLVADGIPLTVDGGVDPAVCKSFDFSETSYEVQFMSREPTKISFGKGCGGAHGVLLVDDDQTLRPADNDYDPQLLVHFQGDPPEIIGDVTGLYRSTVRGTRLVRRRSQLIENRAWLVEDLIAFDRAHAVTSRWYFRPGVEPAENGVVLTTAEGVRLTMRSLLAPAQPTITRIEGMPWQLENFCDRVDDRREGEIVRWLWLLWPEQTRDIATNAIGAWSAWPGGPTQSSPEPDLPGTSWPIEPGQGPPWFHTGAPVAPWWNFTACIHLPEDDRWWIELPRSMHPDSQIWINGREIAWQTAQTAGMLLPVHVEGTGLGLAPGEHRLTLRLCCQAALGFKQELEGPFGPVRLRVASRQASCPSISTYENGVLRLEWPDGTDSRIPHQLLPADGTPTQ